MPCVIPGGPEPLMVIAGASGVVGRHLVERASAEGYRVRVLVRENSRRIFGDRVGYAAWDPAKAGAAYPSYVERLRVALEGADVLVNLAGASLAEGRLGPELRKRVLKSRLDATGALVMATGLCEDKPRVWLQASAIGYYGDTGETEADEDAPRGGLLLSEVCAKWENAVRPLFEMKPPPRIVILRIGLVLAKDAPGWIKMAQPIRWGVGGPFGSGRQWYSWIDADDLAGVFLHAAKNHRCLGVYNATAPEPVRQIDLVRRAAAMLLRPAVMPAPAFALRAVLGGLADELLLPSCNAPPKRLAAESFAFRRPDIESQLRYLLDR